MIIKKLVPCYPKLCPLLLNCRVISSPLRILSNSRWLAVGLLLLTYEVSVCSPDTLDHFPVYRVRGGAPAFYDFLAHNLHYTWPAQQSGTVGTAIASITLTPAGVISVAIVNSLSPSIDEKITTTLERTSELWQADHEEARSLIMFLPITFIINESYFARNKPPSGLLLQEIKVMGRNFIGGSARAPRKDFKVVEKAITLFHEKKFRRAKRQLDELIRRNPFNAKLYRMRAFCRYQTDDQPGACEDYKKIMTLLHQSLPSEANYQCETLDL